jgi:hypothetical protein
MIVFLTSCTPKIAYGLREYELPTENTFYATQFMIERVYGNYLGLCRLGQFVAHALDVNLSRVTCYTGVALADGGKTQLKPILKALKKAVPQDEEE